MDISTAGLPGVDVTIRWTILVPSPKTVIVPFPLLNGMVVPPFPICW